MHGKRYSRLVAASTANLPIAQAVAVMLGSLALVSVQVASLDDEQRASDVYLPVTGPLDCGLVLSRLATLQRVHPGVCVIPMAGGADGGARR